MKNSYKELKVQDLDGKGYSGEIAQGYSVKEPLSPPVGEFEHF